MPLATFEALVEWVKKNGLLTASQNISIEEQLTIFLEIVREGASNRTTGDQFQHNSEIISLYFNQVLQAHICLYPEFVRALIETTEAEISHCWKFLLFFRNCISATDRPNILAKVPPGNAVRF